ncbi:MAG: menaquinone biosynthesis protein [Bacteroidales bacterium]|jgi:chorismate dehydratase
MEKIRISAVKYANTYPFIWGLRESGFEKKVIIETDHPAECAAKLISRRADVGLIPVAALPQVKNYKIIGKYCIGANENVRTVMLFSNCPFEEVKAISLDYRSRSSVNLTRVLAKNMWKRDFRWIDTSENYDFVNIRKDEAVVLIGDQCFVSESKFEFRIDLAGEWNRFTGLPFVFAVWAANRKMRKGFIDEFNEALKLGVDNIHKVAVSFSGISVIKEDELETYLRNNIDYNFDEKKVNAMNLFLDLLRRL